MKPRVNIVLFSAVLLCLAGLLGNNVPAGAAASTTTTRAFLITAYGYRPEISGNTVVWEQPFLGLFGWSDSAICSADLSTSGGPSMFTWGWGPFYNADIDGNNIVYEGNDFSQEPDSGHLSIMINGWGITATMDVGSDPVISGDTVVWTDIRNGGSDIYMYNLASDAEDGSPLCAATGDQVTPAISGDTVVWADNRNYAISGWDIYGRRLGSDQDFPICTAPGDQNSPAIDGAIVVWSDQRNAAIGGTDIYGFNLAQSKEFAICTARADQVNPAVSGNLVVWVDARNATTTGWDIWGRSLLQGKTFVICNAVGGQSDPDVSGNTVVWESSGGIYGAKIPPTTADNVFRITISGTYPAISGNTIVWEETFVDWAGWPNTGISEYDFTTQRSSLVASSFGPHECPDIDGENIAWIGYYWDENPRWGDMVLYVNWWPLPGTFNTAWEPAISGDTVVWTDIRNEDISGSDIYGYGLLVAGEEEGPICTAAGDQFSPDISGNLVVWTDGRNYAENGYDIYGYDLLTGQEFPICTAPGDQYAPAVDKNIVVWADQRNAEVSGTDIYGFNYVTGKEIRICAAQADQGAPAVSGNLVVWADNRNSSIDGSNSDIYGCYLRDGKAFAICTSLGAQGGPQVSGNLVIWQGTDGIYGKRIRKR